MKTFAFIICALVLVPVVSVISLFIVLTQLPKLWYDKFYQIMEDMGPPIEKAIGLEPLNSWRD
jgi:hypothetical protein